MKLLTAGLEAGYFVNPLLNDPGDPEDGYYCRTCRTYGHHYMCPLNRAGFYLQDISWQVLYKLIPSYVAEALTQSLY